MTDTPDDHIIARRSDFDNFIKKRAVHGLAMGAFLGFLAGALFTAIAAQSQESHHAPEEPLHAATGR